MGHIPSHLGLHHGSGFVRSRNNLNGFANPSYDIHKVLYLPFEVFRIYFLREGGPVDSLETGCSSSFSKKT